MCGIAGYYGFNDRDLLRNFSKKLAHRGPDGEGYFFDDNIGLLNRRLAIIDLKSGNQPLYNEDRSVVVVHNGEIYNYRELRKNLEKKGHRFKTQSDTEVIVHSYEEDGEKCFDGFNGMFAVALYDLNKEKLVLARDHFGIKPLHYVITSSKFKAQSSKLKSKNQKEEIRIIFSSEIKPLFYSGLIDRKPNDRIIYRYLKYRVHDDNRETFFKGIYRLMPGELMIVRGSRFAVRRYTNLKKELQNLQSFNRLDTKEVEKFKQELIKAIKCRLISDVAVGTCFSGGIDSSTVVTVINNLLKEKVKEAQSVGKTQNIFSAVFPGSLNDEEKYINEIVKSQKSKVKSYKILPKPEEFFSEIEDFIQTQEEPIVSTGPYAQYKVMQTASKYVKVLLDGQGADEMLAGYLPYYFVYLKQLFIEKSYLRLIREIWGSADIIRQYLFNQLLILFDIKKSIDSNHLLNQNFIERHKDEKFIVINKNLKKRLIEDIFHNSLPALLRYEDRNSMRFSIEARVPFLDFNLLKLLFSLTPEFIIKNGWNKYILRKAVKGIIPEVIRKRRDKMGFITPEHEWFIRMKNRIYQIFLSESFAKRHYFNQQEVLKAFQQFIEGKNNETMVFWRLLNLELWLRIFFDDKSYKVHKVHKVRKFGEPNEGKKLEIEVEGKKYLRFPIKTKVFKKDDDVVSLITKYIKVFIESKGVLRQTQDNFSKKNWFVVVSEKIIAIAQGRAYFIWDIKTSFWARFLSRYVTKTPWGIGLGSPWTMQLAINEVGLWRILLAAFVAFITKLFAIRGLFYHIAGKEIAAIDGPTEYSLYPSNVSAKLGPKEPEKVVDDTKKTIAKLLYGYVVENNITIQQYNNFLGVVIIDANDLGQTVLANSTNLDNSLIEKILKDNPMGQADEQTPLVVIFER